jgi:hypothetical protein
MDLADIKRIMQTQQNERDGLLRSEKIIDRETGLDTVETALSHPNVLAVLGPRRCGKSVFSWRALEGKVFGCLNFDEPDLLGMRTKDLELVLRAMYELYGTDVGHIILDEPQNVPGWELFVNRLRRTKRVIITGSNASLFSGELSSRLTGRHVDFELHPFSFREFLDLKGVPRSQLRPPDMTTETNASAGALLGEYMKMGGFPEAYKFGTKILKTIFNDIVRRDVTERYGIRNGDAAEAMARELVSMSAREISYSRFRSADGVKKVRTVREYISHFREARLMFMLHRFSFKLRQQQIAPKKIYCVDTGMSNAVSFRVSGDLGAQMENLVASELLRRRDYFRSELEIYYWKDARQREVDFVLKEGPKVVGLIQSCYDAGEAKTRDREVRALVEASHQLRCRDLSVLTWDYEAEQETEGRQIRFRPLWKWLMEPSG